MKLSIITINKNNSIGLLKTIDSVINQNYTNFEYIVIDGLSTDGSREVIKNHRSKIANWLIEEDSGIYDAMNKGIKLAQGEYCLFLNSGDRLANPDVLEKVFSSNFSEDIVYGIQLKEKKGHLVEDQCLDVPYLTFSTLKKSHIPHQSTFIKRHLFSTIGLYNESNKIVSDWEFIMVALFKYNCSIKRLYEPITIYDTTGISSDSDKSFQQEERNRTLLKHFPLIMPDYEYYEAFMEKKYIKAVLWFRDLYNKILK